MRQMPIFVYHQPHRNNGLIQTVLIVGVMVVIGVCIFSFNFNSAIEISKNFLSSELSQPTINTIFYEFKINYSKTYSLGEDNMRLNIFAINYKKIVEHNKQNKSYLLGINQFADLSEEEFTSFYAKNMKIHLENYDSENSNQFTKEENITVDWSNYFLPIKDYSHFNLFCPFTILSNQNSTFYNANSIEGNKTRKPIAYQLDLGNYRYNSDINDDNFKMFNEGNIEDDEFFEYRESNESVIGDLNTKKSFNGQINSSINDGIYFTSEFPDNLNIRESEISRENVNEKNKISQNIIENYINCLKKTPLISTNSTLTMGVILENLNIANSINIKKINKFYKIKTNDQNAILSNLKNFPIVVSIKSNCFNFRFYKSGIMDEECGTEKFNYYHCAVLVGTGFDSNRSKPYWKIRNSWGTNWGENGTIRIMKNLSKGNSGILNFAEHAFYPSVFHSSAREKAKNNLN